MKTNTNERKLKWKKQMSKLSLENTNKLNTAHSHNCIQTIYILYTLLEDWNENIIKNMNVSVCYNSPYFSLFVFVFKQYLKIIQYLYIQIYSKFARIDNKSVVASVLL